MNTINDRIKAMRIELRMSQADLAAKSGLTTSAIGNYESGTRAPKKTLELAKALKVTREWLETGKGEPRPPSANANSEPTISDLDKKLLIAFNQIKDIGTKLEILGYIKGVAAYQSQSSTLKELLSPPPPHSPNI